MKIALASDHAGYDLKNQVAAFLKHCGVEFKDFGSRGGEIADYPEYGAMAVASVARGEFDRAILICGTGVGMAMVANKFKGIRATPCWNEYVAEMSRKHNDSNCLTLGGRVLETDLALKCVRIWLETEFEAGRHACRVDKIKLIEEKNFK